MKLTKQIKINIYSVLADYKVKSKNAPFIAIFQFANENRGTIDSEELYKGLLYPLSRQACENILNRLTNMGYFEINNHYKEYTLTKLGVQAAKTEDFYENRKGILKIYIAEDNEFIPKKIVKIEEFNYDSENKTEPIKINTELKKLQDKDTIYELKNNVFIIEKIENQIKQLEEKKETLDFIINDKQSETKILDYSNIYKKYTDNSIKSILLKNEFEELYNNGILKVNFKNNNLSLQRNITILKPKVSNTIFNETSLKNTKVNPKTVEDAKKWHYALIKEQINNYFLSDDEFKQFSNSIASKFELYKKELTNALNRKETIGLLNSENEFYTKSKLETIDYLNY